MEPNDIGHKEYTSLDLGKRMKQYESESLKEIKIEPYRPFIVRLDGRSFSKFTAGMRKPFDLNFTEAMMFTTEDLLTEFTAATGYTHSDEITIVFKEAISKEEHLKAEKKATHIFDGRVLKLLTVMSGYCSVRFNYHLIKIINKEPNLPLYSQSYIEEINKMKASFDARLVLVPEENPGELINHMIWRSLMDCERNAVSTYGRSHFSQKELDSKSKKEIIEMLKLKGINWENDVPFILKHGVYLKKDNYEKEYNNEKVVRTKVTAKTFRIKYNDFFLRILSEKYWSISAEEAKEFGVNNFDLNK